MNKKIFSGSLYCEGLHQLRLMGIVISAVAAVSTITTYITMLLYTVIEYFEYGQYSGITPFDFPEVATFFGVLPFICVPLLVMNMFSYLNKRNGSDFYHSIPYTRGCRLISFSASIMTVIIGIIAVVMLINGIMLLVFHNFIAVTPGTVFPYVFNVIAAAFLVMSAMLIAKSVTGTGFSNVVFTLLLLFMPRLMTTVISGTVYGGLAYLVPSENTNIFSNGVNALFGFFTFESEFNSYSSWVTTAYTFVLAAIYFAVAYVLFKRRPSETAGKSATSRKVQGLGRIAFTLLICLPALAILHNMINCSSNDDMVISHGIGVFIIYDAALVAYFLYELILTRKPKNLLRIIPSLAIVLALNIGILGIMGGVREYELSFSPSADEITGITPINTSNEHNYYGEEDNTYDYFLKKAGATKITDSAVKKLVAQKLEESIEYTRENYDPYFSYYGDEYYFENGEEYYYTYQTVQIYTEKRSEKRIIKLKEDERETLLNTYEKMPGVYNAFRTLPEENDYLTFQFDYETFSDDEFASKVYSAIKKDLKELTFAELCDYYQGNVSTYFGYDAFVSMYDFIDGQKYQLFFPINEYTPGALEIVCNGINAQNSMKVDDIISFYENKYDDCWNENGYYTDTDSCYEAMYLKDSNAVAKQILGEAYIEETAYSVEFYLEEGEGEIFAEYLRSVRNQALNSNVGFIYVSCNDYGETESEYMEYCFALDTDALPEGVIECSKYE